MRGKQAVFLHYTIEEKIGEGGMGAVYKVHDQRLNRKAALKVILGNGNFSEKQLQRFVNEARATASLQHPNIVKVYEVGSTPQHYFTMEFVDGVSLRDLLKQKNLTSQEIAAIMLKCSEAVHYAHKNKIIHRDIKPHNIMMENGVEPKIMDFGLAKDTKNNQQISTTGDVVGTISYMSPEQANGKKTDARSDVYSLGATLYEMLTKRPPFQGEDTMGILCQIFTEDPIEPRLLNPDIPKELEAICLKCLKKKPEKRYQSAAQLASDIDNFIKKRPVRAQPITNWVRFKKTIIRNKVVVAFSLVVIASLVMVTVLSVQAKQIAEKALQEKDKAFIEKVKALQEKDRALQEKNNALQEKNNALQEKKIISYKRNIQLIDMYHDTLVNPEKEIAVTTAKDKKKDNIQLSLNRFTLQEINEILEKTRQEVPEANHFWEYRWQKNRNNYESLHPISQKIKDTEVHSLSLIPNKLFAAQFTNKIVIYNLLNLHVAPVSFSGSSLDCIKISNNGEFIAVGTRIGTVKVYNIKSQDMFEINLQTPGHYDMVQQVTSLSFSDNDSYLLIAKKGFFEENTKPSEYFSSLVLFDLSTKKIRWKKAIPKKYWLVEGSKLIGASFLSCDIGKNNRIFLGAADDRYIYEFSHNSVAFFGPHKSDIDKCQFHPHNKRVIISSDRDQVIFWDRKLYNLENKRRQPNIGVITAKNIINFSISPDGSKMAIATKSGKIQIVAIQIQQKQKKLQLKAQYVTTLTGHEKIYDTAFLNNDQLFSIGDGCKFWQIKKYENPLRKSLSHPSNFCTFHPHKNIAVFGPHNALVFFNTKTGEQIQHNGLKKLFAYFAGVSHAEFDAKGMLYTSGFNGSLTTWDIEEFERIETYNFSKRDINHFAMAGEKIIAACRDSHIHTLDMITKERQMYHIRDLVMASPHLSDEQRKRHSRHDAFHHVSWNKKDLVAVCGAHTWLYIMNPKNMEIKYAFKSKTRMCLLWKNPRTNDDYLFLPQQQDIVKYKITKNGLQPIFTLKGHRGNITHMAVDNNNTRLISCDESGAILFWPIDEENNPLVNIKKLQNTREIEPYFKLNTAGALTFCTFDSVGDKIGCCGGDTTSYHHPSNNFFKIWDANFLDTK